MAAALLTGDRAWPSLRLRGRLLAFSLATPYPSAHTASTSFLGSYCPALFPSTRALSIMPSYRGSLALRWATLSPLQEGSGGMGAERSPSPAQVKQGRIWAEHCPEQRSTAWSKVTVLGHKLGGLARYRKQGRPLQRSAAPLRAEG